MKLNRKNLTFIISLLFSQFVFSYDFKDLKQSMLLNNPEIMKLQEEYSRSLLDVSDARSGLSPTVDLQVSGTYMVNPPIDAIYLNVDEIMNSIQWPVPGFKPQVSEPNVKVYDGMENTSYNFEISVTQPIFTWGKITNSIKLYNQIAQIKQTQLLSKQKEIELELESRVITLVYLQKIMNILEEEKSYAKRLVENSENAEKSGMLLHQDVIEAHIQAKEFDIAQQDLSEQINNQLLELERITGIENLKVSDIYYEVDEERINSILNGNRSEMEENALSSNQLSIRMLTQLKEVSLIAEEIARGSVNWKPDVALQASAGYGGSRFPFVENEWKDKDDYSLNISVGIKTTIWDGGKKLRDVSRKVSESKTADINQLDARITIKKNLNSQWNTVDVCSMKIEYQNLKIETADSKINQQEKIFQTGYGSESDVLSAKIEKCNQQIEKEKQMLSRIIACLTIEYLTKL